MEIYSNSPPKVDSNWYLFAKVFDIGTLDLDNFANLMGFNDFNDLNISISPYHLCERSIQQFVEALQESSLNASDLSQEEILSIVYGMDLHPGAWK